MIICWLIKYNVIHFNELQHLIGTVTYKALSSQLRKMEADGLLIRTEYPQIPSKVEYRLSKEGRSLYPIVEAICAWDQERQENTR